MSGLTLIEKFADKDLISQLSAAEKLTASSQIMILGMGATFVALGILWMLIHVMSKLIGGAASGREQLAVASDFEVESLGENVVEEEEKVLVMAAAIAVLGK